MTTLTSAYAALDGIKALLEKPIEVKSVQEYHQLLG